MPMPSDSQKSDGLLRSGCCRRALGKAILGKLWQPSAASKLPTERYATLSTLVKYFPGRIRYDYVRKGVNEAWEAVQDGHLDQKARTSIMMTTCGGVAGTESKGHILAAQDSFCGRDSGQSAVCWNATAHVISNQREHFLRVVPRKPRKAPSSRL